MPVVATMTLLTSIVQLSNSCSTAQLRGPARSVKLQVDSPCSVYIRQSSLSTSCSIGWLCCFTSRSMLSCTQTCCTQHTLPKLDCVHSMIRTADAYHGLAIAGHWCPSSAVGYRWCWSLVWQSCCTAASSTLA